MTAVTPTPGQSHPLDLPAIAAYGAWHHLDGTQAAALFTTAPGAVREEFRAVADAVSTVIALRRTQENAPPGMAGAMAALTKVTRAHERVMYAAAIDIRRGDPGAAKRILGEQLDGWDGPEWDGAEDGAAYLERTREAAS